MEDEAAATHAMQAAITKREWLQHRRAHSVDIAREACGQALPKSCLILLSAVQRLYERLGACLVVTTSASRPYRMAIQVGCPWRAAARMAIQGGCPLLLLTHQVRSPQPDDFPSHQFARQRVRACSFSHYLRIKEQPLHDRVLTRTTPRRHALQQNRHRQCWLLQYVTQMTAKCIQLGNC